MGVGVSHRHRGVSVWFRGDLWSVCDWAVVAGATGAASANFAEPARAAALCAVFAGAHQPGVRTQLDFCTGLRLPGSKFAPGGSGVGTAAGYSAIDSGAQFFAGRHAGDGGVDPAPPDRRGAGLDLADFHGASVEHRVQLLFVAEIGAAGTQRSGEDLSFRALAKIRGTGFAVRDHWIGLEFDDVGGGRMVFPDGLRNVCVGRSRLPAAGTRLVFANSGE